MKKTALMLTLALAGVCASGCSDPDAPNSGPGSGEAGSPQNEGEPPAPPPPSPGKQRAIDVRSTAEQALAAYADRYSNWTYQTLAEDQRTLAAMSVGAARLAERQAAAASRTDTPIGRGHITNSGQIISIATDQAQPQLWVIVTREQTSGAGEYEGLPAAYHVTLAKLAAVPGGYAVSEWLPQS